MNNYLWLQHYSIKEGTVFFLDAIDTGLRVPENLKLLIDKGRSVYDEQLRELTGEVLFNTLLNEGIIADVGIFGAKLPKASNTVLVLQPHCDDAALSCGGTISKMRLEDKANIDIINFCCKYSKEGFYYKDRISLDDEKYSELRLKEDISAVECLDCNIDFINKDYEDVFKRRNSFIFYREGFLKKDQKNIALLKEECTRILKKYKPQKVLVPAAIGWHADHRMVHQAALEAIADYGQNISTCIYEDYPYCDQNRSIYWERLDELDKAFKLKPVYTDITSYIKNKSVLINLYKSQTEMLSLGNFYKIHESVKRLAVSTTVEGRLQKHCEFKDNVLTERIWEVEYIK